MKSWEVIIEVLCCNTYFNQTIIWFQDMYVIVYVYFTGNVCLIFFQMLSYTTLLPIYVFLEANVERGTETA